MPTLRALQPLEMDAVCANLSQIVMRLLRQPTCCAAAEDLRQPHGHLRRNAALSIHKLRQRCARDTQRSGGASDRQAEWLNTLAQYKAAGVVSSSAWCNLLDRAKS